MARFTAIDLAGLASHVTLLEFEDSLLADYDPLKFGHHLAELSSDQTG